MNSMAKDRAVFAADMELDEPYTLGPDSFPQAGVPRGDVTPSPNARAPVPRSHAAIDRAQKSPM